MANTQQKTIKGPVTIMQIHSSGRNTVVYEGKNHYIDYGIPGEEVTFVSQRTKQGFRWGEVAEVIRPSSYRVRPFCSHHRECSGCTWQHIEYQHQLDLKHEILSQALKKYEIQHPVVPQVIPSPKTRFYRHRVEYAFAAESSIPGFHRFGEPGRVIPIDECFLQEQPSRSLCEFIAGSMIQNGYGTLLRSLSIRINGSQEMMILIGFTEDNPVFRDALLKSLLLKFPQIVSLNWTIQHSLSHGQMQGEIYTQEPTSPYIFETCGNLRFRVHCTSFYQPNPLQAGNIFQTIREWAELKGTEKIYDLYTGVGTIALFLAQDAKHVLGIEGSAQAIEDARFNALSAGISNAGFITGDILETFKPAFIEKNGRADLIVLDPPRSGTLIEIKKSINTSGAGRVIYLSCNPVSLAFDLKQLTEAYRIVRIQPYDMLPNTHHLETLVMLEKK